MSNAHLNPASELDENNCIKYKIQIGYEKNNISLEMWKKQLLSYEADSKYFSIFCNVWLFKTQWFWKYLFSS